MNIFISKNINIDLFCQNPIKILEKNEHNIITVLKKNKPIFYVINPNIFKDFFNINSYLNNSDLQKKQEKYIKKFSMHTEWTPDKDFISQSKLWGIHLTKEVSSSELAYFISYWKAERCLFYHVQWQQKLARSLQKSRSINYFKNKKRNINEIPIPDQKTPDGFRGE